MRNIEEHELDLAAGGGIPDPNILIQPPPKFALAAPIGSDILIQPPPKFTLAAPKP